MVFEARRAVISYQYDQLRHTCLQQCYWILSIIQQLSPSNCNMHHFVPYCMILISSYQKHVLGLLCVLLYVCRCGIVKCCLASAQHCDFSLSYQLCLGWHFSDLSISCILSPGLKSPSLLMLCVTEQFVNQTKVLKSSPSPQERYLHLVGFEFNRGQINT